MAWIQRLPCKDPGRVGRDFRENVGSIPNIHSPGPPLRPGGALLPMVEDVCPIQTLTVRRIT
jgi:hypothetical protein